MSARTEERPPSGAGAAPSVPVQAESPVSVAARVLAMHRWGRRYGKCAGQLALSLLVYTGEPLTEDPDEDDPDA